MLRIGFVGAGVIAWAHALGLQAMIDAGGLDARVAAVYDVESKRASRLAAASGATEAAGLAELVDLSDCVWVCTPTSGHRRAVEEAVSRGRAVFCEKPLATDLAGAEALATTVGASGVAAQVGLVLRHTPVWRELRDLVGSGSLGPPMTAVFRDDQYFPIQGLYGSTWRADVRMAGGGCLIEHSIHDLDILRFCLGEVTEVAGRTANVFGHPGVEDVAILRLEISRRAHWRHS